MDRFFALQAFVYKKFIMSKIVRRVLKRAIKMEPSEAVSEVISETAGEMVCDTSGSAAATPGGFSVSFWLGRRLVMSCFNGQIQIHIGEYQTMGGKEYPTK